MTVGNPTTLPNYTFEQSDLFMCFRIHFPEIVTEWENLKEKAINHDKKVKELMTRENNKRLISDAESIVSDFKRFASELDAYIDNIEKYEIGKVFRKHKNCLICKKL